MLSTFNQMSSAFRKGVCVCLRWFGSVRATPTSGGNERDPAQPAIAVIDGPVRLDSLGFFNQRAMRPTFSSRRLAGVQRAPVGNE